MIDMNTMLLDDNNDVLVYADFWEDPRGILGVLESAKITLLSIPCGDKTQNDADLLFNKLGEPDAHYAVITDRDFCKCVLVTDGDTHSWKIESIRVALKEWNSFIDCFEKHGFVSSNDAIVLSI